MLFSIELLFVRAYKLTTANVNPLKMHRNAINTCVNGMWQHGLKQGFLIRGLLNLCDEHTSHNFCMRHIGVNIKNIFTKS